ncbi:MAG: glutamate synthase small subunit [Luteitalea sp.]|nr:glutamate synthase small subunit [Luteitalea sp.]
MGNPTGFIELRRQAPTRRPVEVRLRDYHEVYEPFPASTLRAQASRCMDCGIPFCLQGCPLGNLIPEWNDLVYRDRWREAIARLHATNNFPEFTGRLCPAPCEASCVLSINDDAVTIKQVEVSIVDRAWKEGWIAPEPPIHRTGRRVAVIGSGPSGLACAQQLARDGHDVVVFERADRVGGLLRYGIPDFKMHKHLLDRRLEQMSAEGVAFRPSVSVGVDVTGEQLVREFDAVCLAVGATEPRGLNVPGDDLAGVHLAMDYLEQQNRRLAGDTLDAAKGIGAHGKRVIILGGGDTGADCLGTAHRQGAREVLQFEIAPRPPDTRVSDNPWPEWPNIFRVSSAHEEGGAREYSLMTTRLEGDADGRVTRLHGVHVEPAVEDGRFIFRPVAGTDFVEDADLVLIATGFVGPERSPLFEQFGVELDARGRITHDAEYQTTRPGVFVAGDARRGASLIVWAIAEGRQAAAAMDRYLSV